MDPVLVGMAEYRIPTNLFTTNPALKFTFLVLMVRMHFYLMERLLTIQSKDIFILEIIITPIGKPILIENLSLKIQTPLPKLLMSQKLHLIFQT